MIKRNWYFLILLLVSMVVECFPYVHNAEHGNHIWILVIVGAMISGFGIHFRETYEDRRK